MKLPALAYALLHNSNIATLAPGQTAVELAHTPQEYGGYQQVEVRKSKEWTPENPRVLVRFTDANRLFRVNKVLAQQRKYDACVETYDPAAPDADSSWQQGLAAGPFVHFTGDSEDGSRHGVVYTLTIVDQAGMLFL